jgi:hypothetical protein
MTRKAIPGYEGLYEVDTNGSVWRRGRALKPSLCNGYPRVVLCKNGIHRNYFVHILVLTTFEGPCPEGYESRHLDDVKTHCRLDNLRWGTRAENVADKLRNGRQPQGERHGAARLTTAQVREIRAVQGRISHLPEKYGVSRAAIDAVRSGRNWKVVKNQ